MLAASLFLEKNSVQDCENNYRNFSAKVFERNNLLGISHFFLNHAFYDAKVLEKALRLAESSMIAGPVVVIESQLHVNCAHIFGVG